MSDTNINQGPPPIAVQQSNNPLEVPEVGEKARKVTGESAVELIQSAAIGAGDTITLRTRRMPQGEEFTGAELVRRYGKTQGQLNSVFNSIVSAEVKTPKLLNSRGEISRDQYTPDDALVELRKMNPTERVGFLNELYKRDFFPSSKGPSATGMDSSSVNAMEQFLMMVNGTGYTIDVAKPMIFSTYEPVQGLPGTGGTPRQYAISAPEDIKAVADRVAEEIIGRRLTAGQAQQIISRVQAAERKAGMQTTTEQVQAPSPQTLAQGMIEQRFAPEAQSMRMGDVTRILDDFMRSV